MKIQQAAFAGKGALLKGNLHCHTTNSDGKCTPETTIRQYAAAGYDFLAITDHHRYNYKDFLPGSGVMIIPGMEVNTNMPSPGIHTYHCVSIGPEKEKGNGFEQGQEVRFQPVENPADAQLMYDTVTGANNLAIFCHPEWSGNTAADIKAVHGYTMMEVWNSGCAIECELDNDAAYWDELLNEGIRVWGVATDDGHNAANVCHGWVRVNAEKSIDSVLDALRRGAFYASCGPEIYDFYVEEDEEGKRKATVICSRASKVRFRQFNMPYRMTQGCDLVSAECDVRPGTNYIRAEVIDEQGRRAWTNPIFFD